MRQHQQQQQFQQSYQPIQSSLHPKIIQYSAGTALPPQSYIIPQNHSVSSGISTIPSYNPMVLSYSMPHIQQVYQPQSIGSAQTTLALPRVNSPGLSRPLAITNQQIFQIKSAAGQTSNQVYRTAIQTNSKNIPQNYQNLATSLPINLRAISPVRIPQQQTTVAPILQSKQTLKNHQRQSQQLQQTTSIPASGTGFQQDFQYLTQSQTTPRSVTPPRFTNLSSNSAQVTPIRSLDPINPLKSTNNPPLSPRDPDSVSFKPEFTHSQTKTIKINSTSPLRDTSLPYSTQDKIFNYSANRSRSNERQNGQRERSQLAAAGMYDNSETLKHPIRQTNQAGYDTHKEYSQQPQDLHANYDDGLQDIYSKFYSKNNAQYAQDQYSAIQSKQSLGQQQYSQELYLVDSSTSQPQLPYYRSHSQSQSQHLSQSNENIERAQQQYASLRSSPQRNIIMYQSSTLPMSTAPYTDKEYKSEQSDHTELFRSYDHRGYPSEQPQGVKQQQSQKLSKVMSSTDKLLLEIANKYLTSQHSTTQSVSQPSPRQPSDMESSSGSERIRIAYGKNNWKDQDQIKEDMQLSAEERTGGSRQLRGNNDGCQGRSFQWFSSLPPAYSRSQPPQISQKCLTEEAYENQIAKQREYYQQQQKEWEEKQRQNAAGRQEKQQQEEQVQMERNPQQGSNNAVTTTSEELRKLLTKQQYYQQFELKLQQQQQQIASSSANNYQKQYEYQQQLQEQQYQQQQENELRYFQNQQDYQSKHSYETLNYLQQTPHEQLQQAQALEQLAMNQQLANWEYTRLVQNAYAPGILPTPAFRQQLTQLPKVQVMGEYYQYAGEQVGDHAERGQDVEGGMDQEQEWKGTEELDQFGQDGRHNQRGYGNNRENDGGKEYEGGRHIDDNEQEEEEQKHVEQEEQKDQEDIGNGEQDDEGEEDHNPNNAHIQYEHDVDIDADGEVEHDNNNSNSRNVMDDNNNNENEGDHKIDYQQYSEEEQDQLEEQLKDQAKMDIYMQAQRVKERLLEMRAQMDEFRLMNSDHKPTAATTAAATTGAAAGADQSVRSLENNPTQNSQVDDSQGIQLPVFSQCSNEKSTHNQNLTGSSPPREIKQPIIENEQFYQADKFWNEDDKQSPAAASSCFSTARKRTKEQLDPISEEDIASSSIENCRNIPIAEFIAEDRLQQFQYKTEFVPFYDAAVDGIAFPQGNNNSQNEQLLFSQGSYENILELYPNAAASARIEEQQQQQQYMSAHAQQGSIKRNSVNQIGYVQQGNSSSNNNSNYHLRSQSDPQSNNQFQSFENTESQARSTVSQHSRQISSISSSFEMLSEQRSSGQYQKDQLQQQQQQQVLGHSQKGSLDSQSTNNNNVYYNNAPILIEENMVEGEYQLENDEEREERKEESRGNIQQDNGEKNEDEIQGANLMKVELDGRIKEERQDEFKYEKGIQDSAKSIAAGNSSSSQINGQNELVSNEIQDKNTKDNSGLLSSNIQVPINKEVNPLQSIQSSSSSSQKSQLYSPPSDSQQLETATAKSVNSSAVFSSGSQLLDVKQTQESTQPGPPTLDKSKKSDKYGSGDLIKTALLVMIGLLVVSFLLFLIQSIPNLSLNRLKIQEAELRQQKILEEARQAAEEAQRLQQNQTSSSSSQQTSNTQSSPDYLQEEQEYIDNTSEWCVSNATRYLLRNSCLSIEQSSTISNEDNNTAEQ